MKGMNLFCSSTASTAVTSTVRRIPKRHASIRRKSQLRVPCSSRLPINPKPHHQKHTKSSADKQNRDVRRKCSLANFNFSSSDHHSGSSSTRYLLGDTPFVDWVSESHKIPSHNPTLQDQVVVLRVSLHCKACEGKLRKHISKMEGVTSFSIDMEAKKVTITGHVTPLGVLASVSKVKNAQLWPSPIISSSSSSLPSMSSSVPMYVSMVN